MFVQVKLRSQADMQQVSLVDKIMLHWLVIVAKRMRLTVQDTALMYTA